MQIACYDANIRGENETLSQKNGGPQERRLAMLFSVRWPRY